MTVVYNEFEPYAADWLEHLIEEGEIAHGIVDRRPIQEVEASEYRRFAQVHLFAGIGIWSSALRGAGWADDRRVGTISCPCQPFSAAGKGLGFADPRHLWPHAHRIVRELGLDVLFGEQAPTAGAWVDLISADLEGDGYAFGAPVIPAAGFGGAHIRQRFYWVADAHNPLRWADAAPRHERDWPQAGRVEGPGDAEGRGAAGGLGDADRERGDRGSAGGQQTGRRKPPLASAIGGRGALLRLEVAEHRGHQGRFESHTWRSGPALPSGKVDWLCCRDGRLRPVESGTFPLATEDPGRVGRLRAYGNALDRQTAIEFITAYMEADALS